MAKSRIKKIIIVLLDILLYFVYGNYILPIIVTSVIAYFLGKLVYKNKNFFIIVSSYLVILLPLIFFKYINNVISLNLLIPLGISYYTLALISYISDLYHDKYIPSDNIVNFMLYCLYFPCLFIGPINKYNDFTKEIDHISFKKDNLFDGLFRICFGLVKKFIIANKLGVIISTLSSNTSLTGLYVLFGCLIYSVFLYCDFSGGVDIVLGISKLFNINLVENFNKPYLSETVKEFWQRWHISLGTWLKDYIYIPLGGNREGKIKTKINVIVTFIISGIWHGIHYILWGIINGIMVAFNFKTKKKYINILLTLIVISLLWIFFIYNDTLLSLEMIVSIFKIDGFNISNLGLKLFDYLIVIIFFIPVIIYEVKCNGISNYLSKLSVYKKLCILLLLVLLVLLFGNYGLDVNSNNFVYGGF